MAFKTWLKKNILFAVLKLMLKYYSQIEKFILFYKNQYYNIKEVRFMFKMHGVISLIFIKLLQTYIQHKNIFIVCVIKY